LRHRGNTESNITFAVENGSPNSEMPENGLLMKRLIFVQHALDRMDERGITKELVIDILNHAESIDSNDEKRKVAQRFIDGKLLRVIYEDETDAIIVITVYKTSKISKYI